MNVMFLLSASDAASGGVVNISLPWTAYQGRSTGTGTFQINLLPKAIQFGGSLNYDQLTGSYVWALKLGRLFIFHRQRYGSVLRGLRPRLCGCCHVVRNKSPRRSSGRGLFRHTWKLLRNVFRRRQVTPGRTRAAGTPPTPGLIPTIQPSF